MASTLSDAPEAPIMVRARELAASGTIVRSGNAWLVPSRTSERVYRVTLEDGAPRCTCQYFTERRVPCKHMLAAGLVAQMIGLQ